MKTMKKRWILDEREIRQKRWVFVEQENRLIKRN